MEYMKDSWRYNSRLTKQWQESTCRRRATGRVGVGAVSCRGPLPGDAGGCRGVLGSASSEGGSARRAAVIEAVAFGATAGPVTGPLACRTCLASETGGGIVIRDRSRRGSITAHGAVGMAASGARVAQGAACPSLPLAGKTPSEAVRGAALGPARTAFRAPLPVACSS